MRNAIVFLAVSAFGTAAPIGVSATCNGTTSTSVYIAHCGSLEYLHSGADARIEFQFGGVLITAVASNVPHDVTSADAHFLADYRVTVTGGTGEGFLFPSVDASGGGNGAYAAGWASASLTWSSGSCGAFGASIGPSENTCASVFPVQHLSLIPFVFGVPQIIGISLSAGASTFPYYASDQVGGVALFDRFQVVDANVQPIPGAEYTMVPTQPLPTIATPEMGTLSLMAVGLCASYILRRRINVVVTPSRSVVPRLLAAS